MENNPQENPQSPGEGQNAQPNRPDTEVNPGKPATNTEVDLDTNKTKTYPDKTPPERH